MRRAACRLDAALFRADTEDEIAVASNTGGRSSFQNVGRTRRQGVEVGAGWQATKTLTRPARGELARRHLPRRLRHAGRAGAGRQPHRRHDEEERLGRTGLAADRRRPPSPSRCAAGQHPVDDRNSDFAGRRHDLRAARQLTATRCRSARSSCWRAWTTSPTASTRAASSSTRATAASSKPPPAAACSSAPAGACRSRVAPEPESAHRPGNRCAVGTLQPIALPLAAVCAGAAPRVARSAPRFDASRHRNGDCRVRDPSRTCHERFPGPPIERHGDPAHRAAGAGRGVCARRRRQDRRRPARAHRGRGIAGYPARNASVASAGATRRVTRRDRGIPPPTERTEP